MHNWNQLLLDFVQSPLQPMPVSLGLHGSLSQGSYALSLGAFQIKHLYINVILSVIPSPHLTQQTRTILVPHVMIKLNDCGFEFSMVCEWCALIKEDKDNSLQFTKIFPTKFLKLPIRQSFPCTILCYMVSEN